MKESDPKSQCIGANIRRGAPIKSKMMGMAWEHLLEAKKCMAMHNATRGIGKTMIGQKENKIRVIAMIEG